MPWRRATDPDLQRLAKDKRPSLQKRPGRSCLGCHEPCGEIFRVNDESSRHLSVP